VLCILRRLVGYDLVLSDDALGHLDTFPADHAASDCRAEGACSGPSIPIGYEQGHSVSNATSYISSKVFGQCI